MPLYVDKVSTKTLDVNGTDITGKAPYKVYTALLTQSGGDDAIGITGGDIVVGVTYLINDNFGGADFTNVGAPNNDTGTYFVATGTTPSSWGISGNLIYNTGAPVVKVLENTIGNIWFEFINNGVYTCNSNDSTFAPENLEKLFISIGGNDGTGAFISPLISSYSVEANSLFLNTFYLETGNLILQNGMLFRTPLEIRVYN
jgi:hypothetical protein